jgi:succinoglycan biosynthesis protein ExoL
VVSQLINRQVSRRNPPSNGDANSRASSHPPLRSLLFREVSGKMLQPPRVGLMQLTGVLPRSHLTGPSLARFSPMTRIAFFGQDAADAAVRRRVQGFRDDGLEVTGFMMRRRDDVSPGWDNVDLGRTFDGNYVQRVRSIFSGARKAAAEHTKLASADVIYARNLDMLATAFLAKRYANLKTPVIYESLDVHRLLTRKDLIGLVFRRIEGALLSRSRRLVVSSPAFLENHFEVRHRGRYRAVLIENRLATSTGLGPRVAGGIRGTSQPLRIGWVGVLRCARSLDLLLGVARTLGPQVRIVMHGMPALTEIPKFHDKIQGIENVEFHGRYQAPEDLSRIYSGLDLVWAGDFMEAGYNSLWLLPNRLYEGGYHAVPAIAPAGTQTATWIADHGAGFIVDEDLAVNLAALVMRLAADRSAVTACSNHLLNLPENVFVQPRGELASLIKDTLRDSAETATLNLDQISTTDRRNSGEPGPPHAVSGE